MPGQELAPSMAEMALEQGAYFLLCDSRSRCWRDPTARAWLRTLINPYSLLEQVNPDIRRFWAPAGSLLPVWLHNAQHVTAPLAPPPTPALRLALYEQQPEYRMLAAIMADLLAARGFALEIEELDYERWTQGEADVDLWLGSVNFSAPEQWSAGAWLLATPLLRLSISGGDGALLAQWHRQWRQQQLSSEALVRQVVQSDWLQPLFHHWLRLQSPARSHGIRLNRLGWFDFKSAWLEPDN